VGTHAQLDEFLTKEALASAMRAVYVASGDTLADAPFGDDAELRRMHHMRNEVLFAVRDEGLRRRLCGKPSIA